MANVEKTDRKIMELCDFCRELDQMLREQEWCSSKDSIIISKFLDDPKDSELNRNNINFFETHLNMELKGAAFKACHLLPGKKQLPHGSMFAVVVKIVYFEEIN